MIYRPQLGYALIHKAPSIKGSLPGKQRRATLFRCIIKEGAAFYLKCLHEGQGSSGLSKALWSLRDTIRHLVPI